MEELKKEKICLQCGRDEIHLLYEIAETLNQHTHLKDVLGPVLKIMAKNTRMVRGTLTILNRETQEILIEESFGLSLAQQSRGKYRPGEGVTGKVVESGLPAMLPRISDDPFFLDKTHSRQEVDKKDISFICVPIKIGKEVVGTLSADRLFGQEVPLDEDVRLLSIVGAMIAQAVRLRQMMREENERLYHENERLQEELKSRFKPGQIIGNSKGMKEVYQLISKVLLSNTTVLVLGESGVGKEMVANAVHYNSFRSDCPFVKVNCAAIPENLIESELFGHEKGAFTGALALKKGKFEQAGGGTLFLDEVGDLPLAAQAKLLRVLQEKEFERVGGNRPIKSFARIITATNRDLEALVKEGKFREDLFYRINVFPIYIPPLRERKNDILLLANHFIEKYAHENQREGLSLSEECRDLLLEYSWPGNVRELENCMERSVLLCPGDTIESHHLPPTLRRNLGKACPEKSPLNLTLDQMEKEMIRDTLRDTRGNMAQAARILGISERVMGLRMKKYGLDLKEFKEESDPRL